MKKNSQRSSSMEVIEDDKDDVIFLPYSRIYAFINCSVINDVAIFFMEYFQGNECLARCWKIFRKVIWD